jgi:hypothetical protein
MTKRPETPEKYSEKRDILSPVKRDLNRKREHRPEIRA